MRVPRHGPGWALLLGLWVVMTALRQAPWLPRAPRLVFGALPVELAWQILYSLAVSVVMAVLVRLAWPRELETLDDRPSGVDAPKS